MFFKYDKYSYFGERSRRIEVQGLTPQSGEEGAA
jgi:4-hydroxy-L-threonine phosphate dehydrogenase PdxA